VVESNSTSPVQHNWPMKSSGGKPMTVMPSIHFQNDHRGVQLDTEPVTRFLFLLKSIEAV